MQSHDRSALQFCFFICFFVYSMWFFVFVPSPQGTKVCVQSHDRSALVALFSALSNGGFWITRWVPGGQQGAHVCGAHICSKQRVALCGGAVLSAQNRTVGFWRRIWGRPFLVTVIQYPLRGRGAACPCKEGGSKCCDTRMQR